MLECNGIVRLALILAVSILFMVRVAGAAFWFQTGAEGTSQTSFNNGGSVSIQTVSQNFVLGGLGFWTGETLSNGAFIQVGYTIENESGNYETNCTLVGCSDSVYISAGAPSWFWEYFPPHYTGGNFLGSIGGNNSAGPIDAFNTYSFKAIGNIWYLYFNDELIGSVDLGASDSGSNPVTAFAEDGSTNSNNTFMNVVRFKDLSFYRNGKWLPVSEGLSYIGYGSGSDVFLKNPYGIEEVNNQVNYFAVGSEIPYVKNFTQLWKFGYSLDIISKYMQNLTPSGNYSAYSTVKIQAPEVVYISPTIREVFTGWLGTGNGAYTGNSTSARVTMYGDITETANWKMQFYVNVSVAYGATYGSGWYDNNSVATVGINMSIVNIGYGSRVVFKNWSIGTNSTMIEILVNKAVNVTANWTLQYLVNVTSQYGAVYGSGWYDNNSLAHVYISNQSVQLTGNSRLEFSGWSNGYANSSVYLKVNKSIIMSPFFYTQYLVGFLAHNQYGRPINLTKMYLGSMAVTSSAYLYPNETYYVSYADYKGVAIPIGKELTIMQPVDVNITLSVYDVVVSASSMFGTPVNATINVTFKNGTVFEGYLGSSGILRFKDVPLGYVQGSAKYFGIMEGINVVGGENARLTFVTPLLIVIVIAGIAIISFILIFGEKLSKRMGK